VTWPIAAIRPSNVLCVLIPQLHPVRHVGDVVQVRVGQFSEQSVHAAIEHGGRAPQLLGFRAQLFEQAERVELAVIRRVGH
jgi:hypothetical protein